MTESARLEAIYYAILGAQPGASCNELRRAYIAKVKTSHPDLFRFNTALRAKAEERMKQINEAYDYLKRLGDRTASEETEEEDDETAGDGAPNDEQDEEEAEEDEDEDEFEPDDWDDFDRWAYHRENHASGTDQTEGPTPENGPGHEPPRVHGEPGWAASVAAISGCYGAIRIAAALSVWSFPVVLLASWTFALIQGLRNKLVVYANIKDVVLSLLTGTVMVVGHLTGNIYTTLIGLLLCLISAIWSIRCNRSILSGIVVCLFKITFAPCWMALMAAPWFLSDDQRTANKVRLVAFRAFMMLLMFKLVNGDRRCKTGA